MMDYSKVYPLEREHMAEKLNDYTWRKRGVRSPKYPWDEWLDGDTWEITTDDISCSLVSFPSAVQNAAKKRGKRVKINVFKEEGRFVIQAFDRE